MDIILLLVGLVLIILGLVGCVLPVIPGPPLSFGGILILHFTKYATFSTDFLFIWGTIAIVVTILDYIFPIWGTKKFGGSKAGVWGAAIGLVFGIFFSPFSAFLSILIGPLVGAVIAEVISGKKFNNALKAGFGSLIGFSLGIGLKLVVSGIMTYYFIKALFL